MVLTYERFPVRRSAISDLFDLNREIDQVFTGVLGSPSVWSSRVYPRIDVAEYPGEFVVIAELPGVRKDNVRIALEEGLLTISGERKEMPVAEGSTRLRSELTSGAFTRSIELPHQVNADAISAELSNGVLRIVLPKAEEAKAREIRIR